MPYETIDVRPVTTALGAEVYGVDLSRPLDNATAAELHRAFLDHLVLFFHDQHMTPEQQITFARRYGELNVHPFVESLAGYPEIVEVLKNQGDSKNFGGLWHIDLTFLETPPMAAILYAKEVPPHGGDTLFTNLYMAYETLSDGMKAMVDGLVGVHSPIRVYGPKEISGVDRASRTSMKMSQTEEATTPVEHPLVRTHPETGRKGLFLAGGGYLRRFKDMTEDESAPILDHLAQHAVRQEFTCRFRWRENSVAFWDNRCVQHYALNDYHGQRRVMHRVAIDGDRPF